MAYMLRTGPTLEHQNPNPMATHMELCDESGDLAIDDVPENLRDDIVEKLYAADVPPHVLDFIKPLLLGQATEVSTPMSNPTSRFNVHRYAQAMGLTSESTRIMTTIPPDASESMRRKLNARTMNNKSIRVVLDRATFRYKSISARTLAKFRVGDARSAEAALRKISHRQ